MIDIAIYENYSIRYFEVSLLEEGSKYSVGRSTEYQVPYFSFSSKSISRNQGYIKSKYGKLSYHDTASSSKVNRTYLNNCDITGEETRMDFESVIAFPCNYNKYAFMFCTRNRNWNFYKLRKQDITVGNDLQLCQLCLSDVSGILFQLQYIDQKYFLAIPIGMEEEVFLLNEYGRETTIEESIEIKAGNVYRIVSNQYLFIIGGDVILYGTD